MENPKLPKIFVIAIFSLVFIVMFGSSMFVTIEPGEKGVIFKRFAGGLDKENVKDQGFHIIAPWNDMHVYNVKIQETFEKMEVLSKNGLLLRLTYRSDIILYQMKLDIYMIILEKTI